MMNFDEFVNFIKDNIVKGLPEEYKDAKAEIISSYRNQEKAVGIAVKKASSNIAPIVYLEPYFKRYQEGAGTTLILYHISSLIVNNEVQNIDLDFICNWDEIKDKVVPKIVSINGNDDYLADKVFTEFAKDLAVIYQIPVIKTEDGVGVIAITNNIFEKISGLTDKQVLHEAAIKNIKDKSTFKTMKEVLRDKLINTYGLSDEDIDILFISTPLMPLKMYVLSNTDNYNGAAQILNEDIMKQIADEIGDDFLIIPSSVHEVIILTDTDNIDIDNLGELITSVNENELDPNERLSDHPYRYVNGQILAA